MQKQNLDFSKNKKKLGCLEFSVEKTVFYCLMFVCVFKRKVLLAFRTWICYFLFCIRKKFSNERKWTPMSLKWSCIAKSAIFFSFKCSANFKSSIESQYTVKVSQNMQKCPVKTFGGNTLYSEENSLFWELLVTVLGALLINGALVGKHCFSFIWWSH